MFRWLIAASLAAATPAAAYWHSVQQVSPGGSSFTGPGDIVSGASLWVGLRAYSAAVAATGTQKAVNIRRQSDNATTDIFILTDGEPDLTAASVFAGTDATCQGTIASTTMALTACSSTPTANDPVSGVGIAGLSYIISCGSFVAGAGSCTLNAAQTVSVAETITMQVALFVTKWYDQSGNTRDVLQVTAGNQPELFLACFGVLPCVSQLKTAGKVLSSAGNFTPATGVVSMSQVASTAATGSGAQFLQQNGVQNRLGASSTPGFWGLSGGTSGSILAAASDSAFHAGNVVTNGASSVENIDGTETTGTVTGSTTAGAISVILGSGTQLIQMCEVGFWDNVAFSSGNRTALQGNQKAYWGTP